MYGTSSSLIFGRQIHSPLHLSEPLSTAWLIFHCFPVMATFIAYQPGANAPPFENHVFGKSPPVASSTCVSSRQSSKSPNQTKSVGKADFVDFVDLTASHQDTPRECLALRELLEPMCHDPDKCGIRFTRDRSSGATCSDKNDDDIDCESEASDLPSLYEIFTRNDTQFGGSGEFGCKVFASSAPVDRTSEERGREGDSEEIADLAAATVTSVQLGASQDNPIVLDDDQPVDAHHDATVPDGEKPTFEIADPADPSHPSSNLSRGSTDPRTNDGKNTSDHLAKYNTDNPMGHEQEEGNESHKDDAVHTRALARGSGDNERSCSDSTDSDAPASVGRIHDVFAEYEEMFGLPKSKQKAARSTLPDCPESETTAGSIPRGVIQGEPWAAAGDGVTDLEQAAESAGGDAARLSKRGIENESGLEIVGQETDTAEVKSQGVHALAGNCHSGKILSPRC
ncbi:hypothetical protein, variant [Exophiala oligosperma]|uniref:Uncharacterized protein n=1 Tax=Exophiala oligosperma TaxID=215243 RepID=A0A0D2DFF6_9EURO|nr:hypothetical protein, variant [Exophiala oligosperma]KIW41808.1 hypothetical protein, variant [Exophiala oligosperma]